MASMSLQGMVSFFKHQSVRFASSQAVSYPMRSLFFVKKSREALEKVKTLQADVVVLDLEDSIAQDDKMNIRELYTGALRDRVFGSAKVFIRSSSLSSANELHKDISTFTGSGIEGFMLPKVEKDSEVIEVEQLIAAAEKEKNMPSMQTKLIPIIETLPAYFALDKIASASKRNIAIIGGSGDFTAEAVCEDHSTTYQAYFSKCVLAAKCAGILPLWGVHDKIDDHSGFYRVNNKMKASGFAGTAALTPNQIAMANTIYSLSPKEIKWIESVKNNGSAIKLIQPSVQESRQMIGPPHRDKARNMLKQYMHNEDNKRIKIASSNKRSANGLSPNIKTGEINATSHECIVSDSLVNSWNSSFLQYSSNRLITGDSSAVNCVPFSLSTSLAGAFSVQCFSYHARAHLGFRNIFQACPIVPGDRVRGMFRIDDVLLKKGGDGNSYAVAKSKHWLVNQHDKVILQLDKATMFQPDHCSPKSAASKNTNLLDPEKTSLYKTSTNTSINEVLPMKPSPILLPGDILVHDIVKVMGHSEVRMLCYLLKIVNPHHHNMVRYSHSDILVPGPFVMAASISSASIDIGEVLYEDISSSVNPNKVNLGDQIGAITLVEKCTLLETNPNLEEVVLKHIAIKNMDMDTIAQLNLPQKLFEDMKPSSYEELCIAELPLLIHKIACMTTRRIIRVRSGLKKPCTIPQELI